MLKSGRTGRTAGDAKTHMSLKWGEG